MNRKNIFLKTFNFLSFNKKFEKEYLKIIINSIKPKKTHNMHLAKAYIKDLEKEIINVNSNKFENILAIYAENVKIIPKKDDFLIIETNKAIDLINKQIEKLMSQTPLIEKPLVYFKSKKYKYLLDKESEKDVSFLDFSEFMIIVNTYRNQTTKYDFKDKIVNKKIKEKKKRKEIEKKNLYERLYSNKPKIKKNIEQNIVKTNQDENFSNKSKSFFSYVKETILSKIKERYAPRRYYKIGSLIKKHLTEEKERTTNLSLNYSNKDLETKIDQQTPEIKQTTKENITLKEKPETIEPITYTKDTKYLDQTNKDFQRLKANLEDLIKNNKQTNFKKSLVALINKKEDEDFLTYKELEIKIENNLKLYESNKANLLETKYELNFELSKKYLKQDEIILQKEILDKFVNSKENLNQISEHINEKYGLNLNSNKISKYARETLNTKTRYEAKRKYISNEIKQAYVLSNKSLKELATYTTISAQTLSKYLKQELKVKNRQEAKMRYNLSSLEEKVNKNYNNSKSNMREDKKDKNNSDNISKDSKHTLLFNEIPDSSSILVN
ncbi:hypothetical protein K9L67_00145 [Candidatus Woesearchaeota archaeon]|nr:hypothetical protein [Candidatus Woesearchaeota archaeon]MCF7900617.1 hypothetical protein [Candidatus Woesearchaeota archaeon]MCF8013458.1 hypothetical protein [Candidatus Woesearchaeota archaeon]